ncbi:WD domain G-beta repeat containing protein [Babesia bovis T2Bo]|uniref:WD domain, G-beta repeat containing protein n=1 Tax=Babesia bovis TaxID=5865 RepID=A7AQP4_BABBO|nr:WD domain G-beta repeat containing protein [Babesia bovis T2Bo]EDO06863.1 WD domain G-beta repeat containing protein [Babesia bovis T2Bo]|eukprot:XP_001610431.1 WD domain, G-beta repeat containing protein [Babesia bovis T2Bo]
MWDCDRVNGGRSSVFRPAGQVGLVSSDGLVCLSVMGSTAFLVSSTQRQYTVYDAFAMRVVYVSLPLQCRIRHIATLFENVFLVLENRCIYSFNRYDYRELVNQHTVAICGIVANRGYLLTYSSKELICYENDNGPSGGNNENSISNGDLVSGSSAHLNKSELWVPSTTITVPEGLSLDKAIPLVGFNNKAILCFSNGQVMLYNVRSGQLVHTFNFSDSVLLDQVVEGGSAISAVVQSELQSNAIVAFGYGNGDVLIVDIKCDQILGQFKLSQQQRCATSLSFVYDSSGILQRGNCSMTAREVLLIGAYNGDIIVFDLSEFRTFSVIERAHAGPVYHLFYIERANNVISASIDNCFILWSMDSDKHLLRELKSRRGLIGHVNMMEPYDSEELDLLVCSHSDGVGHLSKISTIQQLRCNTFSTGVLKYKLRRITAVSSCYQRHYDWPNIATCHMKTAVVHLWSGHRRALVPGVLRAPGVTATATAVCISTCGNYVVVGYESGALHLFNLQSTNHEEELLYKRDGVATSAHKGPVILLSLLCGNQVVSISSSSDDRLIHLWDITKISLKHSYDPEIPKGVSVHLAVAGKLLTALACSNGMIYLVDIIGKMLVRTISYGNVSAMCFHPNGNWLIAASTDCTMVIYDILSACYVDYVKFQSAPLSVHLDSSGAFLNVSLASSPGMVLRYANKHVFELGTKNMVYKDLNSSPVLLELPCMPTEDALGVTEVVPDSTSDTTDDIEMVAEYKSCISPLAPGLLTLSGKSSGWLQSVLYLDEIKERSKPVEPPKPPEELPFFIPTTYKDGQLVFKEPDAESEHATSLPQTKITKSAGSTEFESILLSTTKCPRKYKDMMAYLLSQTPSGVHLALSLLSSGSKEKTLSTMLDFFRYYQKSREHADALQVFLHVFLRYNGEDITQLRGKSELDSIARLASGLREDSLSFQRHFERISCFIKFLTHLQME